MELSAKLKIYVMKKLKTELRKVFRVKDYEKKIGDDLYVSYFSGDVLTINYYYSRLKPYNSVGITVRGFNDFNGVFDYIESLQKELHSLEQVLDKSNIDFVVEGA